MSDKSSFLCVLVLSFGFVAGGTATTSAQAPDGNQQQGPRQEGGGRGPMMMSPEERLAQMTKNFKLTSDQQAKIKPILEEGQKKMMDMRMGMKDEPKGDRQTMRAKMQQMRQDQSDQIRAVLDDNQKEKFDKQQKAELQRMLENQARRGGGPGGDSNPVAPPPQN